MVLIEFPGTGVCNDPASKGNRSELTPVRKGFNNKSSLWITCHLKEFRISVGVLNKLKNVRGLMFGETTKLLQMKIAGKKLYCRYVFKYQESNS